MAGLVALATSAAPGSRTLVDGILGAVGGVIAVNVFEPVLRDQGLGVTAATAFFGGLAVATAVESVMGMGAKTR